MMNVDELFWREEIKNKFSVKEGDDAIQHRYNLGTRDFR